MAPRRLWPSPAPPTRGDDSGVGGWSKSEGRQYGVASAQALGQLENSSSTSTPKNGASLRYSLPAQSVHASRVLAEPTVGPPPSPPASNTSDSEGGLLTGLLVAGICLLAVVLVAVGYRKQARNLYRKYREYRMQQSPPSSTVEVVDTVVEKRSGGRRAGALAGAGGDQIFDPNCFSVTSSSAV